MKDQGGILNIYPDSIGGHLSSLVNLLSQKELEGVFDTLYILPSLFNTDLDRGFSVIDYSLSQALASQESIDELKRLGFSLKLDFILNHTSVLSKEFQDILEKGQESEYADFFIHWNRFWEGYGQMNEDGYIVPEQKYIKDMFFRKEGLPILMVRMPDGSEVPYWNTFYQEVKYPILEEQDMIQICQCQYSVATQLTKIIKEGLSKSIKPKDMDFGQWECYKNQVVEALESRRYYLGQMDLNIKSPLVWKYYEKTLDNLKSYGASVIRLDAFAYAPKSPGAKNFLNEPDTWDVLKKVDELALERGLQLLPEIHATYQEKIHEVVSNKGYLTYDFFLPGLIIDALERKDGSLLKSWATEIREKDLKVVNMLGCHDGIPLLDLKGMVNEDQIKALIHRIVDRGGYVKNLHGQENMYYQVNATYYSALGEDDQKMLLARALQLFMPGRPQVWYLDLFGGTNDYEAVKRAGAGGHKEINRTNLSLDRCLQSLDKPLVKNQIEMIRFRNQSKAFLEGAECRIEGGEKQLHFYWENEGESATLEVDLTTLNFIMRGENANHKEVFSFIQE